MQLKDYIYPMLFSLFTFFSNAQTSPLFGHKGLFDEGLYYKDIDNDFNKFIGTWHYSSANETLTIVIKKVEHYYNNAYSYYEDLLVGEYKYVKNGVEKVNTISNINLDYFNPYDHNIVGKSIIKKRSAPICNDCGENERRMYLGFSDPNRPNIRQGLSGAIILRKLTVMGNPKLFMILKQTGSFIPDEGTNPDPENYSYSLPWGEYLLNKIN